MIQWAERMLIVYQGNKEGVLNMVCDPIFTERLVLRNMKPEDAENVCSIWGDREMGKYLADKYYRDADELRALFHDVDEWPDYSFVAFAKDSGVFIGTCSVGPEGGDGAWGFGYCVHKHYWGMGYATEMALAMRDFARGLGHHDFQGTVAAENTASGNVMRKCGLSFDHESSFKKRGTNFEYVSHIYKGHFA